VGVHYDPSRRKYTVRWTEDRRRRIRRFDQEVDALQFASRLAEPNSQMAAGTPSAAARASKAPRDGIYRYETKAGPRWRFVFIQSDGTRSSRRGFVSRSVAKVEKRRIADEIRRRERVVTRDTFDEFWTRWIRERRPYLSPGSFEDLVTHGHKRLVAYFGDDRLSSIDDARVRGWMASMLTLVERGELAPKTVNNARACLSTALKEAARRGLISRNPCDAVRQLPVAQVELEYLRMHEIGPYLSACSRHYRPLAEFLIGTGTRVSEAIAVRWADIDLDGRMVLIQRQRGRGGAQDTAATKAGASAASSSARDSRPRWPRCVRRRAMTMAGSSYDRFRVEAGMRGRRAWPRRTARPSTTGTRPRSETLGYATCRCTRFVTPPPRHGWPPATP
jgi:hypothetical protein